MGRLPSNTDTSIVLGLFSRESKQIMLFHIADKSSQTIIPILKDSIADDSTIFSDKYSVYVNARRKTSNLEQLLSVNHFWVNHSKLFVDKYGSNIRINNIERPGDPFAII
jgi:hypothetical protein